MKRHETSSLDHSLGKLKDNELLNENKQQQVRKRILSEIDQNEAKGHPRWGYWTKKVIPAFVLLLAFSITITLFLSETNDTAEQKSSSPENENNLSGIDEAVKDKENQDKNIITNVLENTFNGPDNEFREAMGKEDKDFLKAYGQYMKDAFKPYLTNDFYEEYIATYGTAFLETAYRSGYEMKVKNIDYEKTTDETIYNFTLKLQYKQEKSEEWKSNTIDGQANLNDNHLIKGMLIQNTKFLSNLKQENTTEGENDSSGKGE